MTDPSEPDLMLLLEAWLTAYGLLLCEKLCTEGCLSINLSCFLLRGVVGALLKAAGRLVPDPFVPN